MRLANGFIGRLKKKIHEKGAKRIFLQAPEGMKMQLLGTLVNELEKDGIKVFASVEPCYGACDMGDHEAKVLSCDLLVHIGHTNFGLKTEVPVIYEECRIEADPVPTLNKHIDLLEKQNVGVATTLQYLSSLESAKKFLESQGKRVFVGKPKAAKYPGQVLGCDYSGPKSIEDYVDIFLFIGTGMFHPLEFARQTEKPVLFLDLEKQHIISMNSEKEMLHRIYFAQLEKAKDCNNFGIFVSTKPGQMFIEKALKAKEHLEKSGKNAWIIVANEIIPSKILGMRIECLVNCACPRIREDFRQFKIPIINVEDVGKL